MNGTETADFFSRINFILREYQGEETAAKLQVRSTPNQTVLLRAPLSCYPSIWTEVTQAVRTAEVLRLRSPSAINLSALV